MLLALLVGLTIVMVTGGLFHYVLFDRGVDGIGAGFWTSLSRMLDVGSLQEDAGWAERSFGLVLVFCGLVLSSILVAVLLTTFQDLVERAREGSVLVRGRPDLVVLGWSPQVFTTIREFAEGSGTRRRVAVLSSESRVVMEERINRELSPAALKKVEVQCRTGDRADPRDHEIVRLHDAKFVVILAEPLDTDDAEVVRAVFAALRSDLDLQKTSVVAEVCGSDAAHAIRTVTNDRIPTVSSNGLLSLILAQAIRDQGMGQVFQQLMTYEGSEVYVRPALGSIVGKSFEECARAATNAHVLGVVRHGDVRVLPAMDLIIEADDQMIFIEEELHVSPNFNFDGIPPSMTTDPPSPVWTNQQILVIGWNDIFTRSVDHLRRFLDDDAQLTVVVDKSSIGALELEGLEASTLVGNYHVCRNLTETMAQVRALSDVNNYDACAMVPYRERLTANQADAATLVLLAGMRHYVDERTLGTRLVAELRESRSAGLADLVSPDDLILSDSVTASLIAQLVERPAMDNVLADLLDYRGAALFVHPLDRWPDLAAATELDYETIKNAVIDRGELPIGLRMDRRIELEPFHGRIMKSDVSGIVVLGAGVDWAAGQEAVHLSDLR